MTYSDKVKASKDLLRAINALEDSQYVVVEYGVDFKGEPKRYRIECSRFREDREKTYRVHKDEKFSFSGMNIEKFSGTKAYAYTYDLMNQRTTYNFPLYAMKLVEEPFRQIDHDLKFND